MTGDRTTAETETEREQAPPSAPPQSGGKRRWTAGRIALLVVGSLLGLFGLALMAGGGYGLWLHATQRSDGYVMTSSERFATDGYALSTRTLHISSDVPSFLYGRDWLGDVRISGESANQGRPLFIGIARKADVDRYLAGVAHSQVVDINANPFGTTYRPSYRNLPGGAPATPPAGSRFWVASVTGQGSQSLTWSVKAGRWAVVVMRPDGSRGVVADLAAGAKLPALLGASLGLLGLGLVLLGGGAALIYLGGREPREREAAADPSPS